MSEQPLPDRRELRASHDDREQVAEQLRVAAGEGRISADELDERLEAALTARTYGELERLLADLPADGRPDRPGLAPAAKDLVQLRSRAGHIERTGPWVVPRRLEIEARSGHVKLDFTQAAISQPSLDLALSVRSGHVTLIVPDGVVVDVDSIEMRAGHVRQRARHQPGAPVRLAVTVSGQVRSGHITVRGPRRSFWDWLRRRPIPSRPALTR